MQGWMLTRNLLALYWEAFTLQLPWDRQGLPHYAIIKNASDKETYELPYFQISQDEGESESED